MNRILFSFGITALTIFFFSCGNNLKQYEVSNFIETGKQDSLLTDIITYVYSWPKEAKSHTRFEAEHREYYIEQLSKFKWIYYYVSPEGKHHFYVLRPARSLHGHKRGVAGTYYLNSEGKITDFFEVFNTPLLPEEEIKEKGKILFKELIEKGSVESYIGNIEWVEFPYENSYYDTTNYEWAYRK